MPTRQDKQNTIERTITSLQGNISELKLNPDVQNTKVTETIHTLAKIIVDAGIDIDVLLRQVRYREINEDSPISDAAKDLNNSKNGLDEQFIPSQSTEIRLEELLFPGHVCNNSTRQSTATIAAAETTTENHTTKSVNSLLGPFVDLSTYPVALDDLMQRLAQVLEKKGNHDTIQTTTKLALGAVCWQLALCIAPAGWGFVAISALEGVFAMLGVNLGMYLSQLVLYACCGGTNPSHLYRTMGELGVSVTLADSLWQLVANIATQLAGNSLALRAVYLYLGFSAEASLFWAAQNATHHAANAGCCMQPNVSNPGYETDGDFAAIVAAGYSGFYLGPQLFGCGPWLSMLPAGAGTGLAACFAAWHAKNGTTTELQRVHSQLSEAISLGDHMNRTGAFSDNNPEECELSNCCCIISQQTLQLSTGLIGHTFRLPQRPAGLCLAPTTNTMER